MNKKTFFIFLPLMFFVIACNESEYKKSTQNWYENPPLVGDEITAWPIEN